MTDYVRIPIREDEHKRLVALQSTLTGQIDSYLSRPSLSDVIEYLLDKQEIKTMTTQPNYEQLAKQRVNSDDELGPEKDILLEYEWGNMAEHLEWVATAPKADLLSWVLAIRNGENAVATNAEGQ